MRSYLKANLSLISRSHQPRSPSILTTSFSFTTMTSESPQSNQVRSQTSMPRLPVPPLEQTTKRYLQSLVPFLLQSAQASDKPQEHFEREYRLRQTWANELCAEGGLGNRLQDRLIDVDRSSPHNWLDDNYWIQIAYHSNRNPLPIHSNWWILLQPDLSIPHHVLQSIPQQGRFTDWQLRRASVLVHRFMIFKQKLDRQEIAPDSSRAGRFCMHQYDCLYGITRIPQKPSDRLNIPSPTSRHIIVLARDHFYTLDVLDEQMNPIPSKQIEAGLWSIINHVTLQPAGLSIGSLTGLDRDTWTDTREHLLSLGLTNRTSLTSIEDSLFALCLEDFTRPGALEGHIRTASSNLDGSNRWFDKCFSFIVENNSRASVSGEHSPCDALVPAIVTDFVMAEGVGAGPCDPSVKNVKEGVAWKQLEWVTDSSIEQAITQAQASVTAISSDSAATVLRFDDFGVDYIRQSARLSPDAFIQMAMQLAWYRQNGTVVSTYETGLTRLFKHGRTDVIRTLSQESYRWVQAMTSAAIKTEPGAVHALMVDAIAAHNRYTKDVSLGRGIDRHLLGLRLQHRPETDGALPLLLSDEMFSESSGWELSTSGLSAGHRFIGTGFGCFGKGYGINYLAGSEEVRFGIETKRSDSRTNVIDFGELIQDSMRLMRELCEKVKKHEQVREEDRVNGLISKL